MQNMKESAIQRQILHYLQLKKIYCWINKTQGTYDAKKRIFRANNTKKGVADIIGILPDGTFLAIEVKRPGGKLSEFQIEFIKSINDNNGLAFKAESSQDVETTLEDYF